jgi:hypothetical protein
MGLALGRMGQGFGRLGGAAGGSVPAVDNGFAFTMTAGAGFQSGYISGTVGSISNEPLSVDTLFGLYITNGQTISLDFFGSGGEESLGLLTGKTLWIDDVEYPGTWSLGEGLNYVFENSEVDDPFTEDQEYFIEIK